MERPDHPWGYDYWNARLDQEQAKYDAIPRWRWLKRSNQLEAIRMIRKIVIAEAHAELRRLSKKLGKD
jgi:hypothetical protein